MTFTGLLIHTVTSQTATSSQNTLGEWTYSYANGSSITCRCSPISAEQRTELSGYYDDVKYHCFMDDSESVSRGDKLIYNSNTYRVKEVILDSNSHHKTCLLVEE